MIIGGGGKMVAKSSRRLLTNYALAATTAEEVLSSVRTVQAFGTEEKLAGVYDANLQKAQKAGYRKALALALLQASLFSVSYLLFGLAFCTFLRYNEC
jgi:ATP-binding cassette, subfamily B (MDR/TAP), member 1